MDNHVSAVSKYVCYHLPYTCHHGSTLQYIILHTLRLLEILIYRHYCKISAVIITQNN